MDNKLTENTYDDINDLSQINSFVPYSELENKKKNVKQLIIKIFLLSILIFGILRIPLCGCYIDAFLFEYLFGFGKYLIYIFSIILICVSFFNLTIKKRFIIGASLIAILVSIVFSTVSTIWFETTVWEKIYDSDHNKSNFVMRLSYYHNNYFMPYAIKNIWSYAYKDINSLWFMNTRITMPKGSETPNFAFIISGGLIGEFVVSINYWITILFAITLITLICLVLIQKTNTKIRTWINNKINSFFSRTKKNDKDDTYNAIKNGDQNIKHTKLKTRSFDTSDKFDTNTPPLSFLNDTSVDNNVYNKIDANKSKEIITQVLEKANLKIKFDSINVMPLFTEIKFHGNQAKDVDGFIKNGSEIAYSLQLDEFYILTKGNYIVFEYKNAKLSKVSIKSILVNNNIGNNKCYAVVGVDENGNPLFMDYKTDESILIIGEKGSGVSMLLSCLIITSVYMSSPAFLNIDIISKEKNSAIQSIINIPHIKEAISSDSTDDVKKILDKYVKEIKLRQTKLANTNVSDQKSFNKVCKKFNEKPMVTKVLVINSFDQMIKNNIQYISQISYILQNCKKLGICLILSSSEINNEMLNKNIINEIHNILVLKTSSAQQSLKLLNNKRACQLYGSGDGYLIATTNKNNRVRFQTCYLGQIELTNIVKIINNFYKTNKN